MSIKGKTYIKTTWDYRERPVASAKLNGWDDAIEAAFELVSRLLSLAWGGGDGVVRGATDDDLKVAAASPASLAVVVQPGCAFISQFPYKLATATETTAVTPPMVNPRIDLVQARLATWDVEIITGVEGATPSAPSPNPDCIALAEVYLRPGMTTIEDSDDGVNGYITDVRVFL